MSYRHFEHKADTGIIGTGESLEEAFSEGAKAMFDVMVDIKKFKPNIKIDIFCQANDIAGLFVEWLNELLYQKDKNNLFFSDFDLEKIEKADKLYRLRAYAFGEPLDLKRHKTKVEVKGATYSQLKVGKINDKWIAKCVVDV